MADVLIKNVPEGCEEKVKDMALVAIERFLRERDVKIEKLVEEKFKSDVDAIRVANGLEKKYTLTGEISNG